MSEILFRASGAYHIMGDSSGLTNKQAEYVNAMSGKEKITDKQKEELERLIYKRDNPELPEGAKTHCIDLFVARKYGRNTDIQNKYTSKGNQVEEDSMTLFCRIKKEFLVKNTEWKFNDYICGTPDIITPDKITDLKSSFDIYTFFRAKYKANLNPAYYWQLQCYMALTGLKTSSLVYCLIDTPRTIIEDEKRKLWYTMGGNNINQEEYEKGCKELEALHIYNDIPLSERFFEFTVERNDKDIKKIYDRVIQCRKYMKEKFNFPHDLTIAA